MTKDASGRVTSATFIAFFKTKYAAKITTAKTAAFNTFVTDVFNTGTKMMLPATKTTLGEESSPC